MKNSKSTKIVTWNPLLAAAFLAGVLLFASPAKATVILFNENDTNSPVNFSSLVSGNTGYADNVDSVSEGGFTDNFSQGNAWTPNVTTAFTLGTGATAQQFYTEGPWTDVNSLSGSLTSTFYISFTPDSGYGVLVNSFDLLQYSSSNSNADREILVAWKVRESTTSGTIIVSGSQLLNGNTGASFSINTGMSSAFAGSVFLELARSQPSLNPDGNFLATDNINFDQVVIPEPGTVALVTMGLGFVLFRSRKLFGKRVG